jgi:CHAT domain-containing protein/Flp pilus assembly protein TadD
MKVILLSILLSISFISRGQQSLQAIQKTMELFDKGDYAGTISVAEPALEVIKKEFGETSPFYSGVIFFVAISHFRLFNYEKAEPYFLKQMELVRQTSGENNMNYIASLNGSALLYREMGKFSKSESLYTKAITITSSLYGKKDTVYAKSINNLASLYQYIGQYQKAEQLYTETTNIMKAAVGVNSALYATSLNNLATLYADMGLQQKAKPILQQVVQLRRAVLGEYHYDYAGSLNNLAFNLSELGEYREAETNFIKAVEIYRRLLGEKHPDYATSLNNLAELYRFTGEYSKAEQLLRQSMEIRKASVGPNHPDYALSLNNIGSLYDFMGQYAKAEQLFRQSADIVRNSVGENHPYYVTSLNNLAALFQSTGQYSAAEPLYNRSREIRKKMLGESHPSYAMSLNNLATLYQEIGQLKKAEALYNEARSIWSRSYGITHPDYIMCTSNLAALYEDMNDYQKAEPLYIQAIDARKAIFGEMHTDYAASLNNLAGLYARKGDYKKAESFILRAKEIWQKLLGVNNPLYITSLNNVAALYRKAGINHNLSEQFYLEALEQRKKILGTDHPLTSDVENDLALLYMSMGQPQKAAPLFISSSQSVTKTLQNTFPVLSEKEKSDYINKQLLFNECNQSFIYLYPNASSATINNNIRLQLFFKSLSLSDTRNRLATLRNSKDTAIKRLLDKWEATRSLLAKEYALPAARRMKDLAGKEEEAENLEKELSRRSTAFQQQQNALKADAEQIKQKLADDEVAIEFVSFRLYNKKSTDSIIYAAYILKKNDNSARFVPLFEEQQLQQLLDSAGKTASGMAHVFYRGIDTRDRGTSQLDVSMYNLVWRPLEPFLKGVKRISYSPAGKLYGIAFHALHTDSAKLLMDRYRLQQYSSTREIALRGVNDNYSKPVGITLFGNANFTMDSMQLVKGKKVSNVLNDMPAIATATRGSNGIWPDLPGTAEEVRKLAGIFEKNKISTKLFVQQEASEENLKAMNGKSPAAIHIATHGFYLPVMKAGKENSSAEGYRFAEDPMLRSGLVLSGGNYAWGGKSPIKGIEDGIVTAYEIAQLNLASTELVVLSACETALGDIKGTEGVFGLQRSFKMAGVKKMIVSLWQVPDKETAELMTGFYNYWLAGKKIEDAFLQAQSEMRLKYSPFFWAAFVLIQ